MIDKVTIRQVKKMKILFIHLQELRCSYGFLLPYFKSFVLVRTRHTFFTIRELEDIHIVSILPMKNNRTSAA